MRLLGRDDFPTEGLLRVFEISRIRNGQQLTDLTVDLPLSLARRHEEVQVVFMQSKAFGWEAHVTGDDHLALLSFPWTDHVDRLLLNAESKQLPVHVTEEGWDDLDQGWWGHVSPEGPDVYVAQTDHDAISDLEGPHRIEQSTPGIVLVDGVKVRWNVVNRRSWDEAWRRAVESCRSGNPAPVGDWADERGERIAIRDSK